MIKFFKQLFCRHEWNESRQWNDVFLYLLKDVGLDPVDAATGATLGSKQKCKKCKKEKI